MQQSNLQDEQDTGTLEDSERILIEQGIAESFIKEIKSSNAKEKLNALTTLSGNISVSA